MLLRGRLLLRAHPPEDTPGSLCEGGLYADFTARAPSKAQRLCTGQAVVADRRSLRFTIDRFWCFRAHHRRFHDQHFFVSLHFLAIKILGKQRFQKDQGASPESISRICAWCRAIKLPAQITPESEYTALNLRGDRTLGRQVYCAWGCFVHLAANSGNDDPQSSRPRAVVQGWVHELNFAVERHWQAAGLGPDL